MKYFCAVDWTLKTENINWGLKASQLSGDKTCKQKIINVLTQKWNVKPPRLKTGLSSDYKSKVQVLSPQNRKLWLLKSADWKSRNKLTENPWNCSQRKLRAGNFKAENMEKAFTLTEN